MKRTILLFLSFAFAVSLLAGCGTKQVPEETAAAPETTAAAAPETTAAVPEPSTQAETIPEEQPVDTAQAEAQAQVHVSTVDELLAAIAPDTEIILDAELYDLSTAAGYGKIGSAYYHWEEVFDGPALMISGVDNLTIRSNDDNVTGHTIAAIPRYANVLTFDECSGITLSGFTAGHTKEPGSCVGGVLRFQDSDGIHVENCGLFGCGILGVQADFCDDIQVVGCDIYECSQGGIRMFNTSGISVEGTTFRDLGGDSLTFVECQEVTVDGKAVDGNYNGNP